MRQLISGYQQKDDDMRKMMAEFQRKDDAMRQKDEIIMSRLSSLKDQMTVLGLEKQKLEYDKGSLEPEKSGSVVKEVSNWYFY